MTGKDSLGELIAQAFKRNCVASKTSSSCELELIPEDGASSLQASFVKNKNFDAVLGLDEWQSIETLAHREVRDSILFARSPYALIVNLNTWPKGQALPKTWKDLSKLKDLLIVQDPRVSVVGLGWIKAIHVHHLISPEDAKRLTHKTFPSWSLSYSSFSKGMAPLIWSYQTSESYHRCNEEKGEKAQAQFRALALEEGYPQQEEWALVAASADAQLASVLQETLLSPEIQNKIAEKNYMRPIRADAYIPECFSATTSVKALNDPSPKESQALFKGWLDEWSQ